MSRAHAEGYESLARLLESGIGAGRALTLAARNARGRVGRGFLAMAGRIEAGGSFAEAARALPEIFPSSDVAFLEAGESSGRLDLVLESLALWHDLRARLVRQIATALIYPLLILHVAALVVPLPPFIQGNIGLGTFLLRAVTVMACFDVPLGLLALCYVLSGRAGPVRGILDRAALKLPILGKAVRDISLSRYCTAVGLLYEAGMPMLRTVEIGRELCGNVALGERLHGVVEAVAGGEPPSTGLPDRGLPLGFREAWETGEESGRLAETLERLGEQLRASAETRFRWLGMALPWLVYAAAAIYIVMQIFRSFSAYVGQFDSLMGGL